MKSSILTFLLVFAFLPTISQESKPAPPGRQELKDYHAKHVDVPPQVSAPRLDPAKLQKEAAELADLAQSIPLDIAGVSKGVLPKDLAAKLKRIQKIAKHLRAEVAP